MIAYQISVKPAPINPLSNKLTSLLAESLEELNQLFSRVFLRLTVFFFFFGAGALVGLSAT